jgi:hypothetical protein
LKFFLPLAKGEKEAQEGYEAIIKFLKIQGIQPTNRKVYKLTFKHDGKPFEAMVGEANYLNREPVLAIFYENTRSLYYVCTPNRGVLGGMPILVGEHDVQTVEDFED